MDRRIREKNRAKEEVRRKKAKEKSGDIILIVCEGIKTEPIYFKSLRDALKIRTLQVQIFDKKTGLTPISLVNKAIQENEKRTESKEDLPFDEVWCVFDRESTHEDAHYMEAINKAIQHELKLAISNPSFELWYLLHFKYTSKSFTDCDDLCKELKEVPAFSNYDKAKNYFSVLYPMTDCAIKNAKQLRKDNKETQSENPATDVDRLVKKILSLTRL